MPALIRSAFWVLTFRSFFVEMWSKINGLKAAGQCVSPWLYFGSVVFAFSLLFGLSESWNNWKRYHEVEENG